MITINMWKHQTNNKEEYFSFKNSLTGPFFASVINNNVGHINAIFETFTNTKKIKETYPHLLYKDIHSYETLPTDEQGTNFQRGNAIDGISTTLSFWPKERPSRLEAISWLFKTKKGSSPDFLSHELDMVYEAENESCIVHDIPKLKKLQIDKQNLQNQINDLEKELQFNAETSSEIQAEKLTLQNSAANSPDETEQIKSIDRLLAATEETRLEFIKIKKHKEEALNNITSCIMQHVTEGIHPDFTFSLPTSDSGEKYYLNEDAMLKEIVRQRDSAQYSLFHYNCADSIKQCLLAGIPEELKNVLLASGVKKSFFEKKKFEAPGLVFQWALKLNQHINTLNQEHYTLSKASKKI